MARVYQMMGSKSPEILRNAIAGGVAGMTAAGSSATSVANAFGGFSISSGTNNSFVITWRNTNSTITPIVQAVAINTVGGAVSNNRQCQIVGFGPSSCAVAMYSQSTTAATVTGLAMLNIFGQARNDFNTT